VPSFQKLKGAKAAIFVIFLLVGVAVDYGASFAHHPRIGSLEARVSLLEDQPGRARAELTALIPLVARPETILLNGKIITLDNPGINTNPGTIVQAMAIGGGKVMAVGSNEEIRRLAESNTRIIDLKGRTVIPGIIDAHSHLHEMGVDHKDVGRKLFPDRFKKFLITIGEAKGPEELVMKWKDAIAIKVKEFSPGEWIIATVPAQLLPVGPIQLGLITKADLDEIAPNHPVLVYSHPFYLTNTRGMEWIERSPYAKLGLVVVERRSGRVDEGGIDIRRDLYARRIVGGGADELAAVLKEGQKIYARNGTTTYASHLMPAYIEAYNLLDRRGEMLIRFGYAPLAGLYGLYRDPIGSGSNYLWSHAVSVISVDSGPPKVCLSLQAPAETKGHELCSVKPGGGLYKTVVGIARGGIRFASTHAYGDRAADFVIQAILEGSRAAHLSDEQIRARRHGFDHCGLWPRPDQVEVFKRYNITVVCSLRESWRFLPYAKLYPKGEEALQDWGSAVKRLLDAGVKVGFHGQEYTSPFIHIQALVTREWSGKVIGQRQAIDRVLALKMATAWNAGYVLREKLLGSLESGKFADLIVLDKDYLAMPENEIGQIKVLLTMVGGKIVWQSPEL
jgi:predicted amidohydrolase YtcJ